MSSASINIHDLEKVVVQNRRQLPNTRSWLVEIEFHDQDGKCLELALFARQPESLEFTTGSCPLARRESMGLTTTKGEEA